ncbi:protein kinase domain-containing protein [Nitratidesulfovibrio vulgaris]|uniref:protein kinase domain-containing protein n=1 Tax=Nitratidesulfovibrio vulgaris TaxID=881 RepID=UPI0022FFDD24|nr:protein kinase [Nitratidesulfovibrio vulgaris]WCB45192.1 protein kinase [Nitratidesulfovibrio vulgaris]
MASVDDIKELIAKGGKYEIVNDNDEGMNAYAFEARHIPLDRSVFLKVYSCEGVGQDIFDEPRLLVAATSNDDCDNIVKVIDADVLSDEWVLFAMEHCGGGSLLSALDNGPLPQCDAVEAAKDILNGLAHLHRNLFLHRDVKPANVIQSTVTGGVVCKICDFGSVVKIEKSESCVASSRHSALYVPPEGWNAVPSYCIASDVYQAGIVLGELVCGSLDYDGRKYLDTTGRAEIKALGFNSISDCSSFDESRIIDDCIKRHVQAGRIEKKFAYPPYIDGKLKKLIRKAVSVQVKDRYKSANEMISALNSINCPNWHYANNSFNAKSWKGYDWQVKQEGQTFIVRRCTEGRAWRVWKRCSNDVEAYQAVATV